MSFIHCIVLRLQTRARRKVKLETAKDAAGCRLTLVFWKWS